MSEGWFPSHRRMYAADSWLAPTPSDPSNRRDAWCDLLQMAAFRDRQTSDPSVNLKRGELVVSLRTLAKRWCWHYSTVRRFLEELKTRSAIATVSETALGTVYSVVNYDRYAVSDDGERNTERNSKRNNEETGKKQEVEVKKETRTTKAWRICPESWEPSQKHRDLAGQLHVPFDYELTKFREWEFKDARTDASRAFFRWIRRAAELTAKNGNGNHGSKAERFRPGLIRLDPT